MSSWPLQKGRRRRLYWAVLRWAERRRVQFGGSNSERREEEDATKQHS